MQQHSNKIRNIVRIREMLKHWRNKSQSSSSSSIPAGHVAVYVGPNLRRFTVRAKHLNNPIFKSMLTETEEEYGFSSQGPLVIPLCDESLFEEVVRVVARAESGKLTRLPSYEDLRRCCCFSDVEYGFVGESRPLIRGVRSDNNNSLCFS